MLFDACCVKHRTESMSVGAEQVAMQPCFSGSGWLALIIDFAGFEVRKHRHMRFMKHPCQMQGWEYLFMTQAHGTPT